MSHRYLSIFLLAILALAGITPAYAANTKWSVINPLPTYSDFKQVIWDGSRFLAPGASGVIATSPDGSSWTATSTGVIHQLYGIHYTGALYLVVGDRGTLATSTDAINWTFHATNLSSALFDVTWSPSLGRYVAVGANGKMLTSSDGSSWQATDSGVGASLQKVMWNPDLGQFIAIGSSGNIITSTDGLSWKIRNVELGTILRGLTWNGNQYLVSGSGGTVLASTNGLNWTKGKVSNDSQLNTNTLYDVTWDGSQFIAVGTVDGNSGAAVIFTSPDGKTWTAQTSNTDKQLQGVAWDDVGKRLAVVGKGGMLTSSDGVNWSAAGGDITTALATLRDVTWTDSQFVAVGDGGMVLTSPDGIAWTNRGGLTSANLNGITWGASTLVAVGDGGTVITSPDGVAWTDQSAGSQTTNPLRALTHGNNLFVAVGDGGTIVTSPDGSSWTLQGSGTTQDLLAIAWDSSNSQYVAAGTAGTLITSPDGIAWTARNSGTSQTLRAVAEGNNSLLAVGDGGILLSSTDGGLGWTIATPLGSGTSTPDFLEVAWNGTQFLITGQNAAMLASRNGIQWLDIRQVPSSLDILATAWNGNQFVAVGSGGLILASGSTDLALKTTALPEPVTQNKTLTLANQISNTGALYTANTSWQYTLPSGVSFQSATPSQGSCTFDANALSVSCDLENIAPGADGVSVLVNVSPALTGSITSTTVLTSASDINTANNTATVVSTVVTEEVVLENPDKSDSNGLGALNPGMLASLLLAWSWAGRRRL
ncbi:MAG TPA: hypothetical protein ENK48_05795 [Gammaproteobacteria bacterium]|nr:hypothetical protein [Gammaproteobacteria bacterium]